MPFKKGQSGNPGGRPLAIQDVVNLARANSTEALNTVLAIMRSKKASDATRLCAAQEILNRGWGKPFQSIELTGDAAKPMHIMSDRDLTEAEFVQQYCTAADNNVETTTGATDGANKMPPA